MTQRGFALQPAPKTLRCFLLDAKVSGGSVLERVRYCYEGFLAASPNPAAGQILPTAGQEIRGTFHDILPARESVEPQLDA